MKLKSLLIVVAFIAGTCPASGQQSPSPPRSEPVSSTAAALLAQRATGAVDQERLYEDIEIMRRLLDRTLQAQYPPSAFARWRRLAAAEPRSRALVNESYPTLANTARRNLLTTEVIPPCEAAQVNFFARGVQPDHQRQTNLEGVYLKGQGVVYTVTLPPHQKIVFDPHSRQAVNASTHGCLACHQAADAWVRKYGETTARPETKPSSLWEQTRRELRGEKDPPPATNAKPKEPAAEVCGPGTVGEAVLQVLASYGHKIAQLSDQESVTVVITFRDRPAAVALGNANGHGDAVWLDFDMPVHAADGREYRPYFAPLVVDLDNYLATASPSQVPAQATSKPGTFSGEPASVAGIASQGNWPQQAKAIRDLLLLGDLHLKQGKIREAQDAYANAADAYETVYVSETWNRDVDQLKLGRSIFQKLAQAHLANDDPSGAQNALERLAKLPPPVFAAAAGNAGDSTPTAPRPALPAKLVLSAPKRLLDQAGGGKLAQEAFQKAVTVQYLTFHVPPSAKPAKPAKP